MLPVATDPGADPVTETHRATAAVLTALRDLLADGASTARLAVVTRGAPALLAEESPDPAARAVWGLVRTAQTEHPTGSSSPTSTPWTSPARSTFRVRRVRRCFRFR